MTGYCCAGVESVFGFLLAAPDPNNKSSMVFSVSVRCLSALSSRIDKDVTNSLILNFLVLRIFLKLDTLVNNHMEYIIDKRVS